MKGEEEEKMKKKEESKTPGRIGGMPSTALQTALQSSFADSTQIQSVIHPISHWDRPKLLEPPPRLRRLYQ